MSPFNLPFHQYLGKVSLVQRPALLEGGQWLTFHEEMDGLEYRFEAGFLALSAFLSADFLLDGNELADFVVELQEGEQGPTFRYSFGLLNQCQARMRMPLAAANLDTWMYPREGAFLKPLTSGQRVDPSKVDRLRLRLFRFSGHPATLCLTHLSAFEEQPPLLSDPVLPAGALLDEFGQSTLRDWPQKVRAATELIGHLQNQHDEASQAAWAEGFSRWGGWMGRQWQATGFFRTAFEEERWWLVDPDGHPFWSTGLDCVSNNIDAVITGIEKSYAWLPVAEEKFLPCLEQGHWGQKGFNFGMANLIRAFGDDAYEKWSQMVCGLMRSWGFNTIANWSDWHMAARLGFPYVRPLRDEMPRSRRVYRTFPDVFHPDYEADAADYASQLVESREDPAFIGYFLLNEPTWGFSSETLAEGMLFNTPHCETRRALAEFLGRKYASEPALISSWGLPVTFEMIADGAWTLRLTEAARSDLEAFSTVMVARYFSILNAACKKVDPNHLNLGARYYTVPPEWVLKGMNGFDVFSINCYREQVPPDELAQITASLGIPVMVGEWHFGALDVGLPASGIGHVADQSARGQAYRVYVENAAAIPSCVGVHYFTLYDQSAQGRFDGENYNIGFLDVCHRPYDPLVEAARQTHHRLYEVAAGKVKPYADAPEYLPRVFL